MATDILFNFYEILVENIFGGVGIAIMGIALALILILMITRTSGIFILYWMIFYFIVMGTLYIGAFGAVLAFIAVTIYTSIAIIRFFTREG